MRHIFALFCALFVSLPAVAQYAPANAEWNKPIAPLRIAGNLYYVGAAGISSYLIATPQGDILIDGGFRETASQIEANIRKLGFHVEDVRILLNTHEHFDHAGGLAGLKADTHAELLVNPGAVPLLTSGGRGTSPFTIAISSRR
jgi:metallo-beta-lactamase class B